MIGCGHLIEFFDGDIHLDVGTYNLIYDMGT